MAGELQAMNFITTHIENLPLNDNGFGGERLPTIFCYHEGLERNSKAFKVNKVHGRRPDNNHSRSLYESRSNLNENSTTLFDSYQESRSKSNQVEYKLVDLPNEDVSTCSKLRDTCSTLSTSKRKRSTDSTDSDSSKSICDEEIRRICERRTFQSLQVHARPDFQQNRDDIMQKISPIFKKKFLSKSQSKQTKPNPPPAVLVTKRHSTPPKSWLPFHVHRGERKVKVIRVRPLNSKGKDIHVLYGERFCEERFFRPIRTEECTDF